MLPARGRSQLDTTRLDRGGPLSETIHRKLRHRIVLGILPPGTRLVEVAIAREERVSRTPVRQALSRLRVEGFAVEHTPGSARSELRVAAFDRSDVEEFWQLIGALEALAVTRIERLDTEARAALVDRLRCTNNALRRAATRSPVDSVEQVRLQRQFHTTLVEQLAGRRLLEAYRALRPHVERYEWLYFASDPKDIPLSLREHDGIIAAVDIGASEPLAQAVSRHWQEAARRAAIVVPESSSGYELQVVRRLAP